MMYGWKVVFLLSLFMCSPLDGFDHVMVKTPLGSIQGVTMTSRKGQNYYAFRGIRYAKPPIGENRFRPPVPVEPWTGILDATIDGYICPQYVPELNKSLISEDCLILNVYTKALDASLPVMIFIHGGEYQFGGSHSEIFWGPQYLMDKDIVFVTINYRLGPLGFLSTGTSEASGNYGFKDQVLALKWVRNNIRSFGGDPNMVTLCGHSSGSMSGTLHLVSPMSQGLFHRMIAMSGSSTSHILPRNQEVTKRLAQDVGCLADSAKLLVDCLRNVPHTKMIEVTASWATPGLTECWWNYEIESNHGQERFITEHPTISYLHGNFSKIPILAGFTRDEFRAEAYVIYNNSELLSEFNNNFNSVAPKAFLYNPNLVNISTTLRSAYLNNTEITLEDLDQFGDIFSHAIIMHGVHRLVDLSRKYTQVFYYRQDFVGRYSWNYGTDGKPIGIHHADDLLYILVHKEKAPMFKETDPENVMVEKMTELWATFARTGNPNNYISPWTSEFNWTPSDNITLNMIHINENSSISDEPYENHFKLWDKLFPISFSRI